MTTDSVDSRHDELLSERAALAGIEKAHFAYLDQTRKVAAGLAAEAAAALEDGIRDIVDEDAEADAAVQAVLVRQISERAMYAARRVADLEAQGNALAFGKLISQDQETFYVGRRTVFSGDEPLLVDWRARAAIPFYRATPLDPMGYRQRRHLVYGDEVGGEGLLTDYSDEIFDIDELTGAKPSPDGLRGEAALLAGLMAPTQDQMRSVVATIQAEQDAVIRAPGNRMLLVQGGPGTGKTVVALHRAAYLLYDQRVELADTGVLIVGPSNDFLQYISGVLPSLGESGVVSVTVPRLYRGVRLGYPEPEPIALVKAGAGMANVLAAAVQQRQRRPKERFVTWYGSRRVVIEQAALETFFDTARRHPLHNDGAATFRRDLVDALVFQVFDPSFHNLDDARDSFSASDDVREFVLSHFPPLSAEQALNDLLGSKGLLRSAALACRIDPGEIVGLHRPRTPERDLDRRQWSDADASLLDELLSLVGPAVGSLAQGIALAPHGDIGVAAESYRDELDEFELAVEQDAARLPSIEPTERGDDLGDVPGPDPFRDAYFDDSDDAIDDEEAVAAGGAVGLSLEAAAEAESNLDSTGREDRQADTADGRPAPEYDGAPAEDLHLEALDAGEEEGATIVELAGSERSWQFGHVIVDEAQDLTPMQWRMVARRSSGGALTVVGDLAQRMGSKAKGWDELVPPSLSSFEYRELTINYRSPSELDKLASGLLAEIAPDLTVARSLRQSGVAPIVESADDPNERAVELALSHRQQNPRDRVACIISDRAVPDRAVADRLACGHDQAVDDIAVLTPRQAKGLEFDTVVVVEPADIYDDAYGANALYVAVTRPTQRLIIVHARPLPLPLAQAL